MTALGVPIKDKVAIVTGGASGMGLATVNLFLDAGALVAAVDVKRLDDLPAKDALYALHCDVSDDEQVKATVKAVVDKWGRIDVLVNCAGVCDNFGQYSPPHAVIITPGVADTTNAIWERTMKINVDGVFYFSRECFPYLARHPDHKGSIVNVSSIACKLGGTAGAAYTVSKHAVTGLTKNTAKHNKGKVTCNAVLPGMTSTNILDSVPAGGINEEGMEVCKKTHALGNGEWLEPDHIARAILFLATNPMINGATLEVDNGYTA
ncbi:NAD(P)-binding protein [Punctularia strigosozonata HHB-11173 SS5]|uniref:NAD(P)-binding protein n=1 Tax=Punctularia strigosozonata (strain HHB-11173) TaxID=741275 RepID=UPI0004416FB3|nr:NAD(P)-binding protein [Punctularia strigosozonata HHB-11173 SS5]EIN11429.1 NAD(P)-binding protein [Punctularia strigosozonata HHB-11173 SS5]